MTAIKASLYLISRPWLSNNNLVCIHFDLFHIFFSTVGNIVCGIAIDHSPGSAGPSLVMLGCFLKVKMYKQAMGQICTTCKSVSASSG